MMNVELCMLILECALPQCAHVCVYTVHSECEVVNVSFRMCFSSLPLPFPKFNKIIILLRSDIPIPTEAHVMRLAVQMELVRRHCQLDSQDVFALADQVVEWLKGDDPQYLDHLNTCLATQISRINIKVNYKGVGHSGNWRVSDSSNLCQETNDLHVSKEESFS